MLIYKRRLKEQGKEEKMTGLKKDEGAENAYESPIIKVMSKEDAAGGSYGKPYGTCYSGNTPGGCRSSHECINHGIGSACHSLHTYNWQESGDESVKQDADR